MIKYQFRKKTFSVENSGSLPGNFYILVPVPVYPEGELETINISKEGTSVFSVSLYIFNNFSIFSSIPLEVPQSGSFIVNSSDYPFVVFSETINSFPYSRVGVYPIAYKTIKDLSKPDFDLEYRLLFVFSLTNLDPGTATFHLGLLSSFISR